MTTYEEWKTVAGVAAGLDAVEKNVRASDLNATQKSVVLAILAERRAAAGSGGVAEVEDLAISVAAMRARGAGDRGGWTEDGSFDEAADAAERTLAAEASIVPAEAADAVARTGRLTKDDVDAAIESFRQFERLKNGLFREGVHFVMIQRKDRDGRPVGEPIAHTKREGAWVLATRLRVDTPPPRYDFVYTQDNQTMLKVRVTQRAAWGGREVEATGTCERRELKPGSDSEHDLVTKAETRAYKRAVLMVLGSADPLAPEE